MTAADTIARMGPNSFRASDSRVIAPLLEGRLNLQEWFDSEGSTLKKTGKLTARLICVENTRYFVKRYRAGNFLQVMFGVDKALNVYRHSAVLVQAGLPVVEALAYIREGRRLAPVASYLVSRSLEEMTDLRHFSESAAFEGLAANEEFFASIARDLARLHQMGYCHGDLKWANIMVQAASLQYTFVDLDGLRKPWLFSASFFAKDLARFILNAREKGIQESVVNNFVSCYSRERGLDSVSLMKKIERCYQKLLRRHRKTYGVDI